jgi:hypothetical protein
LIDCGFLGKEDAMKILRQRQYIEHTDYWIKGFVKVQFLDSSLLISVDHEVTKQNGVRCFYEASIFMQTLQYFENKFKYIVQHK